FKFVGEKEPIVSKSAKLASPVEYTHHVRKREEFSKHSALWAGLLAAAFVLFGLVLFRVMPQFSLDATRAAESYGAAVGLRVLGVVAVPLSAPFCRGAVCCFFRPPS